MHLTYICIVIALVLIVSYEAYPSSSSFDFDDIPRSFPINSQIIRRDVLDPYGLNSILSRFIKRNQLYDIPTKRTIHLINRDEYDWI